MSDSSRPHGLQPTRLLHSWDFPGNSTGVGCRCLLQATNFPGLCCAVLVTQWYPTLCNPMDCGPQASSVHGDSPGKNTGVGCHVLLQGIFPTQELNRGLLQCKQILHSLATREDFSQLSPAINFSLLQTPIFQFVWSHCALGTPAYVQ